MSPNIRDKNIKIFSCRICLDAKCDDMVLLEEHNGWLKQFEFCFGFALSAQDEPRVLCKECADSVQNYVKFKQKCLESNILWKSVISDVKCVVKQDTIRNANTTTIFNKASIDTQSHISNIDKLEEIKEEIKVENNVDSWEPSVEEKTYKDDIQLWHLNETDAKRDPSEKFKGKPKMNNIKADNMKVKKVFKCKKCKKDYTKELWYLTHIKVCQAKTKRKRLVHYNTRYAFDCGRNYDIENAAAIKNELNNDANSLKIKKKNTDNQNQDKCFPCGLCAHNNRSIEEYCRHLREHWSNNDLSCQRCDFVGVDMAAVMAHRFSHYSPKKMRFLCHICAKVSGSLLALHFHYRMVHLKKTGGFCSRCNIAFPKLRQWKRHEIQHTTPEFVCDICGRKFFFKHRIREHMMIHSNFNLKKCVCDICGNVFNRSSYLKLHIETVHTQSGPLKCTHCNRLFKNEHTLKIHQKIISRAKLFKCEVCFKECVTPNVLKLHMVSHSDLRPYCCDICGNSYKAKSELKIHMWKHNGFYPHKCQLCTKAFVTQGQLKRHSSVHTGVRNHKCIVPQCARTFHSKKLMLEHCALRHKNENIGEVT